MDINVIDILNSVLSAFIGAGAGGGLLFIKQNKKIKNIEAESRQSDEWKKLYDDSFNDSKEKEAKIDKLNEDKIALYNRYISLQKENGEKDLKISELNWYRCETSGCKRREPPRKYEKTQ